MVASSIPILDCSQISGAIENFKENEGFTEFLEQLGVGMSGIGFVYLVNHGIPSSVVEKAFAESRKFFELSQDIKMKYRKTDAVENFHGYTPPEDERVNKSEKFDKSHKDHKEAWDSWGQEILKKKTYPKEVPELYGAINGFRLPLSNLSKKLLLCFGHYLKLEDPEFFLKRHRALDNLLDVRSHNDIRTNYYGASNEQDIQEGSLRLGEHNDWGTITLLTQDTLGGLEAKQTDGQWISVTPIKDSIILNAGLMLEMWSGGHIPATEHRVRLLKQNATNPRQSIGFFIQPDGDSNCLPLIQEKPDWKPLYPKVDKETHFEYFKDRVRGTRAY